MLNQLLCGALVSLFNFGIHAMMTGLIIVVTRHVAGRTDDLHVFMRVTALLTITVIVLTISACFGDFAVGRLHDARRDHGAECRSFRIRVRKLCGAGLWRRGRQRRLAPDRSDHGAQRTAVDRLVGRRHFRGHAHGRGADRAESAIHEAEVESRSHEVSHAPSSKCVGRAGRCGFDSVCCGAGRSGEESKARQGQARCVCGRSRRKAQPCRASLPQATSRAACLGARSTTARIISATIPIRTSVRS